MLWSLIKLLVFVAIAGALAWGAGLLMESGRAITLSVEGWTEINVGPLQAVLLLLAALVTLWLLLLLVGLLIASLRYLAGDETAVRRYFARRRERRGYDELGEAVLALASGDGKRAVNMAKKAERDLRKPELTNLITAQAAEMSGDTFRAESSYRKLLANDKTRFVGIRGIMKQKLAEGDTEKAMQLAEKAFALMPRNLEVQDTLLKLQAEAHDWKGARRTLGTKLKQGALPRDLHRRRDAVLAVSQAKDVLDAGNSIEAREAAIEANRLSPDMIPAAVMAARGYIEDNKPRNAVRIIKKAWEAEPHPDLATVYAEIAKDETPKERVARFEQLLRIRPNDPETKMLRAELLIAAEDFPAARRAMGDLASEDPTTRSLAIMAAIARGEGEDEAVVRGYLARAVSASRGPKWVCDNCTHIEAAWGPICSNCGAFDSLTWRRPKEGEGQDAATGAEMLPLVVGGASGANGADTAEGPTEAHDAGVVEGTATEATSDKAARPH